MTVNEYYPVDEKRIPQLLESYTATLSLEDQALLKILHDYDSSPDCNLGRFHPMLWGAGAGERYADIFRLGETLWSRPNENEIFGRINGGRMRKTAEEMPLSITPTACPTNPSLYDPRFFLPLFASVLGPASRPDLRSFVSKGALALALSSTSLRDTHLRSLAYLVLHKFCEQLRGLESDAERGMTEKSQLLYLLTLLRNSLPEKNTRVPCLLAHFLARAGELMLHPVDPCYAAVNNFLLLKPSLELDAMPEFIRLFHSSAPDNFRKERQFMLNLMVGGTREARDFRIIERRYGFKVLLSYFNSHLANTTERKLILKLLNRVVSFRPAAFELCRQACLPAWLLAQSPTTEEELKDPPSLHQPIAKVFSTMVHSLTEQDDSELPLLLIAQLKSTAAVLGSRCGEDLPSTQLLTSLLDHRMSK